MIKLGDRIKVKLATFDVPGKDGKPQEISREEALKMGALMQGMSDESPLRAIEAGK